MALRAPARLALRLALLLATFTLPEIAGQARAAEEACFSCCRAGGLASCRAEIVVFGEGGQAVREGAAWRVVGLWEIGCNGVGAFDSGATVALDHAPQMGELIVQSGQSVQVHCFRQACAVPPGACITPADSAGRSFLVDCASELPLTRAALSNASPVTRASTTQVVVVGGRPLVVQPVSGTAFAAGTSAGAQASFPASFQPSVQPPMQAPVQRSVQPPTQPPDPAAAYSLSPLSAPAPMPAPMPAPAPTSAVNDAIVALAASLPADPPTACKAPPESLRGEARKRVDSGDDRRLKKDALGALKEYRAALTMDPCNAYAWNGIGDIANDSARPDLAVRALRNTTRLLPGHYGAWTMLGRNYEALRQPTLAAEAYAKALELRPGLTEALDGWRRTAGP